MIEPFEWSATSLCIVAKLKVYNCMSPNDETPTKKRNSFSNFASTPIVFLNIKKFYHTIKILLNGKILTVGWVHKATKRAHKTNLLHREPPKTGPHLDMLHHILLLTYCCVASCHVCTNIVCLLLPLLIAIVPLSY